MKPTNYSEKAQLIAFVLQNGKEWKPSVIDLLESTWGPIRYKGKLFAFDKTHYYENELGTNLHRGVVSFEKCIEPEMIVQEKYRSNEIELTATSGDNTQKRFVNVDIGYMDLDKVVLPSFKRGPFKIYSGNGVWLDMLLTYAKGLFHPTSWAFEDFKRNPYQHDLQLIREYWRKNVRG